MLTSTAIHWERWRKTEKMLPPSGGKAKPWQQGKGQQPHTYKSLWLLPVIYTGGRALPCIFWSYSIWKKHALFRGFSFLTGWYSHVQHYMKPRVRWRHACRFVPADERMNGAVGAEGGLSAAICQLLLCCPASSAWHCQHRQHFILFCMERDSRSPLCSTDSLRQHSMQEHRSGLLLEPLSPQLRFPTHIRINVFQSSPISWALTFNCRTLLMSFIS